MLQRHLNFRQIPHRFSSSFVNPSFQYLNGSHIKYNNFKSVEVQGWTPLKTLIFLHWTLPPTFTTLLGKRRAISHWMGVQKNRGKCKSATISLLTEHVLRRLGFVVYGRGALYFYPVRECYFREVNPSYFREIVTKTEMAAQMQALN